MINNEIDILKKALARERQARKEAEKILEEKSRELYTLSRKLKNDLNETTTELEGVFDNLVDAYVLMDIKGNVVKMNQTATALFGYNIATEKINVLSLIYEKDMPYAMESFHSLLKDGAFSDYQARVNTKNKGVRNVHINASIIKDETGKTIAAQGIVRDITQELLNAQQLEEQRRQLAVIVDNSSLGIVLTQFGKILQTNKAFENILGYTKEELINKEVKYISLKEEYPSSRLQMDALNKGDIDNFSINKRYIKKNKTIIWARTNVAAVRHIDGSIKYQVALIEDISEEIKNEEERKQLIKDLKHKNQDLNDFAHIVSHDLKSPLRGMDTLINWIQEDYADAFDEKATQTFTMLLNKVSKMDSLIDGILKYSSIDKKAKGNEQINLNQLVTSIIDILHIPENTIITITNTLPVIKGDISRLQQLFQNLLNNALNSIDKDKGVITIDAEEQKSHWQFSISDNGKGIAKAYQTKIFEIFESLEDNNQNTGIGLSIVKKIVQFYEGEIWLESQVGIGTSFYFTLKK